MTQYDLFICYLDRYPDINVTAGTALRFVWHNTAHGVTRIPSRICPLAFNTSDIAQLAPVTNGGDFTTPPLTPGDYFYACPVGHLPFSYFLRKLDGFISDCMAPAGEGWLESRAPCAGLSGLANPWSVRFLAPLICSLSADAPCLLAGKVTFPASVSLHALVILMMHGLPSHMHQPSLAACICMHATLLHVRGGCEAAGDSSCKGRGAWHYQLGDLVNVESLCGPLVHGRIKYSCRSR